jgi:hypothetical protein
VTFLYMGLTGPGTPNYGRVDPDNCFKSDRWKFTLLLPFVTLYIHPTFVVGVTICHWMKPHLLRKVTSVDYMRKDIGPGL